MAQIVAFLLLHFPQDEETVFWCLVRIFFSPPWNHREFFLSREQHHQQHHHDHHSSLNNNDHHDDEDDNHDDDNLDDDIDDAETFEFSLLDESCDVLDLLLEQRFPKICHHFQQIFQQPLQSVIFATPWFLTIFSYRWDLEFAAKIWDVYIRGDAADLLGQRGKPRNRSMHHHHHPSAAVRRGGFPSLFRFCLAFFESLQPVILGLCAEQDILTLLTKPNETPFFDQRIQNGELGWGGGEKGGWEYDSIISSHPIHGTKE